MTRSHLALVALLSAPVALYGAVILPREIPADYGTPTSPAAYFPNSAGSKWVYKVTQSGRARKRAPFNEIELVTSVSERDGESIVTVRELEGDSPYKLREWSVSETGLRRRTIPDSLGGRIYGQQPGAWIPELPSHIAPGEMWTHDIPSDRERAVYTIAGWETVRVPAGAYRALRVNVDISMFDHVGKQLGTITGAFWYVPGIGEVKMEFTVDAIPFHLTRELIAFMPGRQ